jgi:hypothetical protein
VTTRPRRCPVHEEWGGWCGDSCLSERIEMRHVSQLLDEFWRDRRRGVRARGAHWRILRLFRKRLRLVRTLMAEAQS